MTAIIIWILAAVGLVQAILAVRAYRLERREGLPRSSLRLGASVAIAASLVTLGVVLQLQRRSPAPVATVEHDQATQAKIDALHAKIAELLAELAKQRTELDALDPSAFSAELQAEARGEPPAWPLLAAVALVLVGFGVLMLGDLWTLLPRRRADSKAAAPVPSGTTEPPAATEPPELADLPTLSAHVAAGRWKAGLACASRIAIERLHKLDVLDVLFLRAYCNVSAVVAPEDGKLVGSQDRSARLAAAAKDLTSLLELAPHMAEARWLVGYVAAHAGDWQVGLDTMRTGRAGLAADRAFDHDDSVCLLMLAEARLADADNDGATRLFDEITRLGVLANQIPVAMVTHRILTVREHIKAGRFADAADGLARIRQVTGLEDTAQRTTEVACDVYEVAIQVRSGEHQRALDTTRALLGRWAPAELPEVEDQVADEFLLPAIDVKQLPLPASLYRALFFLEAVARVELGARRGQALAEPDVEAIATALLRALQFQPRHRESLAALAALYLAYRKERTEKAIAWLDAALTLGVRSPRARGLLGEARRVERERKELLAMFRSASARFLSDPAVAARVREALIEELGRFDEFRPIVLDLQASGALDARPAGDVTVGALRERAAFVGGVASEVVSRADPAAVRVLGELHRELTALVNNVDTSATRIAAVERAVMEQLGRIVLR
jgi:tetratricopeptide (TPR) repeat protein